MVPTSCTAVPVFHATFFSLSCVYLSSYPVFVKSRFPAGLLENVVAASISVDSCFQTSMTEVKCASL